MNREQKAAAIAEIAGQISEAEAIFAVDYRGISRCRRPPSCGRSCATPTRRFRVVKNTLTERAADEAGAEALKELLDGPDRADVRARRRRGGREGARRLRARPPTCWPSRAA